MKQILLSEVTAIIEFANQKESFIVCIGYIYSHLVVLAVNT
jgi:hypothetical protein